MTTASSLGVRDSLPTNKASAIMSSAHILLSFWGTAEFSILEAEYIALMSKDPSDAIWTCPEEGSPHNLDEHILAYTAKGPCSSPCIPAASNAGVRSPSSFESKYESNVDVTTGYRFAAGENADSLSNAEGVLVRRF